MNLMNVMMLSCIKATELLEMKEHVSLGVIKTLQLHFHLSMCSGCRNYRKQTKLINKLLNTHMNNFSEIVDTGKLEKDIISKVPEF